MKMRHLAFTACSDDYDDTELWNKVNDHEDRIEALETWQGQMNNNIAALQELINTTDYITTVTPVLENGEEVGYTIAFLHSDPITIYHGEKGDKGDQGEQGEQGEQGPQGEPGEDGSDGSDGSDGDTPVIGVKADGGIYYWTVNGEWLLNDNQEKMPVTGEKGEDGDDAIAPRVRINEKTNMWEISTDDGTTWTSTEVEATGDSFFQSVDTSKEDYVTFTLEDGTTFQVPRYQSLKIGDGTGTLALIGAETEIKLTLPDGTTAADYSALVAQITPEGADGTYTDIGTRANDTNGWSVTGDLDNSTVTVTAGSGKALLRVTLIRNDGGEVTASRIVEKPNYTVSTDGKTYTVYNADGLIAWANAAIKDVSVGCILAADIDMKDKVLPVVGDNSNFFAGTFDGAGHEISNLRITAGSGKTAAFIHGSTGECIVKNLTLNNPTIKSENSYAGGIVGNVSGSTTIINCHIVGGTITGGSYVGGIASFIQSGSVNIYACSSTASLEAKSTIGGIVGGNSGTNNTGGGTITACYVKGSITATGNSNKKACGIAGENCGTITAAYWQADGVTVGTLKIESNTWVDDTDNSGTIQVSNDDGWNDDVVSAMNKALSTANISGYEWIKNTGDDSESRPLVIKMN